MCRSDADRVQMAWRSGNRHQSGGWISSKMGRLRLCSHSRFRRTGGMPVMKVCIVGASGQLGQYMVQHALGRGYEVVGVCRAQSVAKLDAVKGRMTVIPGPTDDREVITKAVAGCDGVLTVLVPRGVHGYSTGTAQAVLDLAPPGARLVFSCGWHITRDGQDVYSRRLKWKVGVLGGVRQLPPAGGPPGPGGAWSPAFSSPRRRTRARGGR